MNLLENYKQRLAISESVFNQAFPGERMSDHKKLVTAKLLQNTANFINEAFDNSIGTNRADMGAFKKFALDLVTVAMPTLIAPDLVLTYPMSSLSGYVNYISYTAGSNKGGIVNGIDGNGNRTGDPTVFEDAFHLSKVNEARTNYTSSKVAFGAQYGCDATCDMPMRWSPVIAGSIEVAISCDTPKTLIDVKCDTGFGVLKVVPTGVIKQTVTDRNGNVITAWVNAQGQEVDPAGFETAGGTIYYGTTRDDRFNSGNVVAIPGTSTELKTAGIVGFKAALEAVGATGAGATFTFAYNYNNVYVPQNDIPLLNARVDTIPLVARARRIAVYYSQIAAFQAKQDYGFDLGKNLAERAAHELALEIDTEIVGGLADAAKRNSGTVFTWNRAQPVGVSLAEHYESFAQTIAQASQVIYDRTQKFMPTYMVVASDVIPVMQFMRGWKAAPTTDIHGPYFAGNFNSLRVYVSPRLGVGEFFLGVNGNDMMTSAAVYAPYMPIVPTQLLQYADGGTSQGFSTMYDFKILNASLLVFGRIVGGLNSFQPVENYVLSADPGITGYSNTPIDFQGIDAYSRI